MTTESDGLRQSDRVRFRMPVEASWVSPAGHPLTQNAETLLVSRNGGVLRLTEKLSMGQELHLRRSLDGDQWKIPAPAALPKLTRTRPTTSSTLFTFFTPAPISWISDSLPLPRVEKLLPRFPWN